MSAKVHVLTRDYCPGSDESSVATHQLYQTNTSGHATRLRVRAIKHAFCFFNALKKPNVRETKPTSLSIVFGTPTTESA
jgi:hypothetical protein